MTRQDHINIISNDLEWPHPVLPLKRYPTNGLPQLGLLTGSEPRVYLTNMFDMDLENCQTIEYSSIEEMVDDGWEVD